MKIKKIIISLFFSTSLFANVITGINLQENHKNYSENIIFSYSDIGILEKYINKEKGIKYKYEIEDYSDKTLLVKRSDYKNEHQYYKIVIDESTIQIINGEKKEEFYFWLYGDEINIKGEDYQLQYSNSNFHFQTQNADYYFNDSLLYDKKSYGKFLISRNVRDIYRITNVFPDAVEMTCYCPYDNSFTGCFSYDKENSYLFQIEEGSIPLLFRFVNYYISMADDQYNIEIILPLFISEYRVANKNNRIITIESTSFLVEKEKKYEAENLMSLDGLPWASGNGYGINDKIMMYIEAEDALKLVLYNGFQSSEKKYLYSLNSRVKKIKLTDIDMHKSKIIMLEDKKEKQLIDIENIIGSSKRTIRLEIEILDIYKGTKYPDLCIQAIMIE